jgi:hypothetical protein
MEEFFIEGLFIGLRDFNGLKEELSKSPSRIITSKSLHLPVSILFFIDNVYRKLVFRDVLDKRLKWNFEDIQSNGELLYLNYSLVTREVW